MQWTISKELVSYPEALDFMEQRVADIQSGNADEMVWLLEHPPLYTAGTSADPADLIDPERFPVYDAGRGGQYTYHGPGQRVGYFMLDLRKRGQDVRQFVWALEEVIVDTLKRTGVLGERRDGRVGVWVDRSDITPGKEDKIAAIGVRVKRWVTYHGIAINIEPDLSHFDGIVPCGISEHGVTSYRDLGLKHTLSDVDAALKASFDDIFGLEPRAMRAMPESENRGKHTSTRITGAANAPTSPRPEDTHPTFQT